MFKRVLSLSTYPAIIVFLFAGLLTIIFAFQAANLFQMTSANLGFLQEHGWVAIREGGLVQLFWLGVHGLVALASYLGFRFCESDLSRRYWAWVGK